MNLRKQLAFIMISLYAAWCFKPWYFPEDIYKELIIWTFGIFAAINIIWFCVNALLRAAGMRELITVEKRTEVKKGREFGMDITRIVAVLFVPFIHFFGDTNYYGAPIEGQVMFLMTALRWLVLTAVPIFMIITGYFKSEKNADFSHYKAIIPVLLTHIVCCLARLYTDKHIHGIELTAEYIADKLLYFNYGWYVRLYIGLILLVPFLNKMYKGCESRKNKEMLILTIILLTAVGPLTYDVIPVSWLIIYVMGYYFIGSYIREYKIRINPVLNIMLIALTVFLTAYGTYGNSGGGIFNWDYIGYSNNSGYSSLPAFIVASLIVILLSDMTCPIGVVRLAAKSISILSLEMYLFSQMYDMIIYKPYQQQGYDFTQYIPIAGRLLTTIILLSLVTSAAKKIIFYIAKLGGRKIRSMLNERT